MSARILLAGGGSGGSATPVLAVAQALRRRQADCEFLYVGTREGPERALAEAQNLPFAGVSSGKLRRYWDTRNLTDPIRIVRGLAESSALVRQFRPTVAFAAGGFAAVPPMIAARMFGALTLIHQQDVEPGLANRLLVPFASRITVSLETSLAHFPRGRTEVTGNPVRQEVLHAQPDEALRALGLDADLPIVVITGGGTGALSLNRIAAAAAPTLVDRAQVVHLTGRGRGVSSLTSSPRYRQIEFLVAEMPHLLAAATLVVSRAGLGTLTELAALGKPSIIIPMPGSHQWANAHAFSRLGAIEVVDQLVATPDSLSAHILGLLDDEPRRTLLGRAIAASMPRDAADRIASRLL